jgi:hypothetical protein
MLFPQQQRGLALLPSHTGSFDFSLTNKVHITNGSNLKYAHVSHEQDNILKSHGIA